MDQLLKDEVYGDYFGDYGIHIDNRCDPGGYGAPIVSIYKNNEIVKQISICRITREQQKDKLQEFYDSWVKPMKCYMPLDVLAGIEDVIKRYSLTR
jgi:hypothetical protein